MIGLELLVGIFLPFLNLSKLFLSFLFEHLSQIFIESTKLDGCFFKSSIGHHELKIGVVD